MQKFEITSCVENCVCVQFYFAQDLLTVPNFW